MPGPSATDPRCPCGSALPFARCCADARRASERLTPERLEAWAAERGVQESLRVLAGAAGGEARQVGAGVPAWLRWGTTVGELLLLPFKPMLRATPEIEAFRRAAFHFLQEEAQAVRDGLEAAAPGPGLPAEGALGRLAARLLALRAEVARQAVPRALGRLPPHQLLVDPAGRRVRYSEWRKVRHWDGRVGEPEVTLALAGALEGPLAAPPCSCRAPGPCTHLLAALDASLAELTRPERRGPWETLAREVAEPDWARALGELEGLQAARRAAGAPGSARLSFRIVQAPADRLCVVPWQQVRRKDGSFGAPRRLTEEDLAGAPDRWPEEDRAALDRLGLTRWNLHAIAHGWADPSAGVHAVEALIGHPRVFLAKGDRQVEVARGTLGLAVRPAQGGGVEVGATVAGAPLELGRLRRRLDSAERAGTFLHLDEEAGRAWVVTTGRPELLQAVVGAFLRRGPHFPPEAEEALLERLEAFQEVLPLELDPALAGVEVAPAAALVLRVALREAGLDLRLLARPLPGAAAWPPGEGPVRLVARRPERRVTCLRDREAERQAARDLAAALPLPAVEASPFRWVLEDDQQALALLEALRRLDRPGVVVEWDGPPARVVRAARAQELRVEVRDRGDWFGLGGHVEVDGVRVRLALLLEALRAGRRVVRLEGGAWLEITEALARRLAPLAHLSTAAAGAEGAAGEVEVGPGALATLEDLARDGATLDAQGAYARLRERMRSASRRAPAVPRAFRGKLRGYQVEGFRWLARLAAWGAGAVLADDMGLGKTLQALALLCHRAKDGPALVVAPTSVCSNWVAEAARFAPSLRVRLFRDADRAAAVEALGPGDVLVVSYGLLALDLERFKARAFSTLVLDEAQAVKNAATRRARAARELQAGFRLALSGTPAENHLGELWSIFRIAFPGLLGSWELFRDRFAAPIEQDGDEGRRLALAATVRPFLLRRTKGEVARELPSRTEITIPVIPTPDERAQYEAVRLAAAARLARLGAGLGPEQRRFQVLAAITQLRLLACHPRLHDEASRLESSKLARFMALVGEVAAGGHRALVFSQFTAHLALVRQALDAAGVAYLYLDGQTPPPQRDRLVARFQAGEGTLFLISLKAGGTGLNLTGADFVLHLDPWWNPAVEDQATDRAHRIGQRRPVTVYRLVAQGTIEEAILGLHGKKRALVQGVLDGMAVAGRLTADELMELVRHGEAGAGAVDGDSDAAEGAALDLEGSTRPDPTAAEDVAGWMEGWPVAGGRGGAGRGPRRARRGASSR